MDINTIKELLVLIAPSLTAAATIIGGIIYILKVAKSLVSKVKKDTNDSVDEIKDEMKQIGKDIATLKSKTSSMENYMLNEKEKK